MFKLEYKDKSFKNESGQDVQFRDYFVNVDLSKKDIKLSYKISIKVDKSIRHTVDQHIHNAVVTVRPSSFVKDGKTFNTYIPIIQIMIDKVNKLEFDLKFENKAELFILKAYCI